MEGARLNKTSLEEDPTYDSSEDQSPTRTEEKPPDEPSVDHDEESSEQNGCCYRFIMGSWVSRWPRSCSFLFGVALPLLSLILLSMLFGVLLAKLEAPDEISSNDSIIASEVERLAVLSAVGNFSELVPRLCVQLFLVNNTEGDTLQEQLFDLYNDYLSTSRFNESDGVPPQTNETEFPVVDLATDLTRHMIDCLKAGENVTDDIVDLFWEFNGNTAFQEAVDSIREDNTDAITAIEQLSLTWVRCYPGANGDSTFAGAYSNTDGLSEGGLRPLAQQRYFSGVWAADFLRLREEYANSTADSDLNNSTDLDLTG